MSALATKSLSFGALVLAAFGVTSCGPDAPADRGLVPIPATPATLTVEVGTGSDAFVALADGDAVSLVHGLQGGVHIWTAIRIRDATVTNVQMNLSAHLEDGSPVSTPSGVAVALQSDGAGKSVAGQRTFISNADAVTGKRVVLRVEVVASDQRHGAGERVVTVQ